MSHFARLSLSHANVGEASHNFSSPYLQSYFPCPHLFRLVISDRRVSLFKHGTFPQEDKTRSKNLTEEDGEAIRKVMAGLEKHLKSKNQSQAAVDFELKKVKEVVRHDPTLRIFVKRIVISVSLELIKVILILFNFSFFFI